MGRIPAMLKDIDLMATHELHGALHDAIEETFGNAVQLHQSDSRSKAFALLFCMVGGVGLLYDLYKISQNENPFPLTSTPLFTGAALLKYRECKEHRNRRHRKILWEVSAGAVREHIHQALKNSTGAEREIYESFLQSHIFSENIGTAIGDSSPRQQTAQDVAEKIGLPYLGDLHGSSLRCSVQNTHDQNFEAENKRKLADLEEIVLEGQK